MNNSKVKILVALILLFSFGSPALFAEELKLSIGKTAMSNIFAPIKAAFEKETGIKLIYLGNDPKGHGGDQVFKDVDQGLVEGGAGSLPLDKWIDLMKKEKYEIKSDLKEFKAQTVGLDRVQIMTYLAGPKKLSEQQLIGIFTGEIKNWKEVGGEDRPIVVVLSHTKQPSTVKYLEEKLLEGKKFIKNPRVIGTEKDDAFANAREIGATPGAIGFAASLSVDDTVKVNIPEHPTLGRPLVFLFKGAPTKNVLTLLKFIREKGQLYGIAK